MHSTTYTLELNADQALELRDHLGSCRISPNTRPAIAELERLAASIEAAGAPLFSKGDQVRIRDEADQPTTYTGRVNAEPYLNEHYAWEYEIALQGDHGRRYPYRQTELAPMSADVALENLR